MCAIALEFFRRVGMCDVAAIFSQQRGKIPSDGKSEMPYADACATRPLRPPRRIDFFGSFCIKAKRTKYFGAPRRSSQLQLHSEICE
jgi:hypothetical protein